MQKVLFFPHPNLRDRQLDTIRLWPQEEVLNPEITEQKPFHYSAPSTTQKQPRKNWHQYIPAINIKCRPRGTPKDAVVYCFGGVISHADFITELDNPYVMTGYNVGALRLYAPLLRAVLLSRRCREIRCISAACRETLRRELGDAVANRARLVYPKISDLNPQFLPLPVSNPPKLLFISTNFVLKAGPSILRIMRRLQDANIPCHLTMITYLPDEFRAEAEALKNITIVPANLPRAELAKYYETHDVMLHPTFVESFGMVVLEALARGMALVATDVYAIPELAAAQREFLLTAPISIWAGAMPTRYFANADQVTADAAAPGRLAAFEDLFFEKLAQLLDQPERISQLKIQNQQHIRRLNVI